MLTRLKHQEPRRSRADAGHGEAAASIIEFKEAKGNGEEFDAQVVALRAWETGRKLLPALRGLMGEMKKMPKDQLAALQKEVEPEARRFLEGLGQ